MDGDTGAWEDESAAPAGSRPPAAPRGERHGGAGGGPASPVWAPRASSDLPGRGIIVSRATATKQAKAARALRTGASQSEAARKAGVSKRTIQRWQLDPDFAARVRHETQFTVGRLPARNGSRPSTDLLGGLPPSRAWVSVQDRAVFASAIHPARNPGLTNNCDPDTGRPGPFTAEVAASIVQVELISTPERAAHVTATVAAERAPDDDPNAVIIPLTLAGLHHVQDHPDDLALFIRAATDFRAFLDLWQFRAQEAGTIQVLGSVMWEAQQEFVQMTRDANDDHTGKNWVYFLKARKLGETTIACAYDAWVMRFRDANARVHLFSRREDAAQELLTAVRFGLERLPAWLQLPLTRGITHEYELCAGPDDRRLAKAYPADRETAVESSCTHGHVDEWARMVNPQKVWQAIEPTMAGSCHIVTTGLGPTNYSSSYWRRCLAGDARHKPCFVGALTRPDRNPAWLKAKRASMDEQQFRQEYPSTWEDALSGGGEFVFRWKDLDAAGQDTYGLGPARAGRKYVKAWDIGRHQDAAVGIVLDVTEDVHDVVAYQRLRAASYPEIQYHIETMHHAYPGITVIEDNAAGEAVRENLDLPERQVIGFKTTPSSKARIIQQLKIAAENWVIKWDAEACAQLDAEMRGYQLPDENVVQDSVMALAIALEHAPRAHVGGRILGIIYV